MTAVSAICSQYYSPFQYMCCFERIGCAADLTRVLPIRKSSCNDSIGGWDTVYVRWPRRCHPKRGEECVYTVLQRRMWHWLRSLGVLRPIIIGKAERRTEQLSRWPRLGSRGNLFFSLLSRSLSLSFFLFPLPDISINNVFRDRIFVFLQHWTRTVVLSADWGENKTEATGRRAREK